MGTPRGSVSFKDVSVREFNRIVGDHPDCKFGPPLAIGWEYAENKKIDIDEYEATKPSLQRAGSLKLMSVQRRNILHGEFGIPLEELFNPNTGDGTLYYVKKKKKRISMKSVKKVLYKIFVSQEERPADSTGSAVGDCERMLEEARKKDEMKAKAKAISGAAQKAEERPIDTRSDVESTDEF